MLRVTGLKLTETDSLRCWACMGALDTGQKICLECKSWQNWRSYLNVVTFLSAVSVAAVSLASIAAGGFSNLVVALRDSREVRMYVTGEINIEENTELGLTLFALNASSHEVWLGPAMKCSFQSDPESFDKLLVSSENTLLKMEESKAIQFNGAWPELPPQDIDTLTCGFPAEIGLVESVIYEVSAKDIAGSKYFWGEVEVHSRKKRTGARDIN